jgi:hypothetical protein
MEQIVLVEFNSDNFHNTRGDHFENKNILQENISYESNLDLKKLIKVWIHKRSK